MKRFFGLWIILALWADGCRQPTDLGIEAIVQQALQSGNAQQLATYFDTNIELIIDSEAIEFASVRATHAEFILKSFFRKYPPQHFQYVYQNTADHEHYNTGTYQTGRERFQVYVLMREATSPNGQYRTVGVGPHRYLVNTLHFRKVN